MKAKVLSYSEIYYAHYVETDDGEGLFIDLMINEDLPENTSPKDLIGKTVEWKDSSAFVSIAYDVSLVQ